MRKTLNENCRLEDMEKQMPSMQGCDVCKILFMFFEKERI